MQVLDGGIAYMPEESYKPIIRCRFPILVESYRMAIAIEGAVIHGSFGYSYVLTHRDVGC